MDKSIEFDNAKWTDTFPVECDGCGKTFHRTKRSIIRHKAQEKKKAFCSDMCSHSSRNQSVTKPCEQCGLPVVRHANQVRKHPKSFCNRSCSAMYRNANKIQGVRRSKLEAWLEQQLLALYPLLEFHFNRKDAINSELDIYIPSLKLAFELNGIFHYEPIFGSEKLGQIQNNDQRKHQACNERGIELCLIDTSSLKYFKPEKAKKYLSIITSIIDNCGPDRV